MPSRRRAGRAAVVAVLVAVSGLSRRTRRQAGLAGRAVRSLPAGPRGRRRNPVSDPRTASGSRSGRDNRPGRGSPLGRGKPPLVGVAPLVGVTAAGRVARITLRWVAALIGRVATPRVGSRRRHAGLPAWAAGAVAFVVILVAGPPLSLGAAVAGVVSHRYYSWFCVERVRWLWWGGHGIGVDRSAGAKLAGVQLRRLLESDNDITIRLPSLLVNVVPPDVWRKYRT